MSFLQKLNTRLFTPVNNIQLVLFRMLFGLIMAIECWGSVVTGNIREMFVDTRFNFSYIGFEWLGFLHGPLMYGYYIVMGLLGLFVAAGLYYRLASALLSLTWIMSYLSEKSHYNNHYYLMILLCVLMMLLPAHKRLSLDVKWRKVAPANLCYNWQVKLFAVQVAIVYLFAAIAKLNPDWLQAMPAKLWMVRKQHWPVIGGIFRQPWLPWCIAYGGLLFDLLITPGLLFRRTRVAAFCCSVFFHLSNSIMFSIGTFPYLAISLCIFFFPPAVLEKRFRIPAGTATVLPRPEYPRLLAGILTAYLLLQLWLPVRHWFIPGNVSWTEEGHRMAWRMMLRSKHGYVFFHLKDLTTGKTWDEYPERYLSREQAHDLASHPDFCWQFAQYLRRLYSTNGRQVAVFADGRVGLNGRMEQRLYRPDVNLAAVRWRWFGHNEWVTLHD